MRLISFLISYCAVRTAIATSTPILADSPIRNPNHIFNAIHSSMRQWGSSLNHNGMSYFLASVPEGTLLYHGTSHEKRVDGMEWLAFEPEHSLVFAHSRGPPGRGPPGGRKPPPDSPGTGKRDHSPPAGNDISGYPPRLGGPSPPFGGPEHQDMFLNDAPPDHPWYHFPRPQDDHPPPVEMSAGWLHTYRAKNALRLLYIDGMSAGKTTNGTLDSQDLVLLNATEPHEDFWEYERAAGLCKMAQEEWEGRIDGVIRMEAGFEIILCDFAKHVDLVRATRAGGSGREDIRFPVQHFRYLQAVADRYSGIGGGRVQLDYEHFVSVYTYAVDLFGESNELPLPRLLNISFGDRAEIRKAVRKMVLEHDPVTAAQESFNWQAIADMVVARYSTPLRHLTSGELRSNTSMLSGSIEAVLQPFLDYDNRNQDLEALRCAEQFTTSSPNASTSIAAEAVTAIARSICSTLVSALHSLSKDDDLASAVTQLDELMMFLQWPTWKQCRGCADDELCFVPIWPFGSVEDYKRPACQNATSVFRRSGYWGHRRGGPPPLDEKKPRHKL